MICKNCGYENSNKAKFCAKCGTPLTADGPAESGSNKTLIIALVIVIIILVGAITYFALGLNSPGDEQISADSQQAQQSGQKVSSSEDDSSQETTTTTASAEKSWVSIGSYSGSGSGSQTVKVPSGQIMIKLSAYPIKNYATNHLYVTGSNGQSAGVDWGSTSAVATRSDSLTYTSSSSETFTIDYYETVSWEVEFYRYQ